MFSKLSPLPGIYLSLALSLRVCVCVLHYIQVSMSSILISQENTIYYQEIKLIDMCSSIR